MTRTAVPTDLLNEVVANLEGRTNEGSDTWDLAQQLREVLAPAVADETTEWLRPIDEDPSGETVARMFALGDAEWLLSAGGDYQTAGVEVFNRDGGNYNKLVALEWPSRVNRSDELRTVRLLIAPEDAVGLALVLISTARWLVAADA